MKLTKYLQGKELLCHLVCKCMLQLFKLFIKSKKVEKKQQKEHRTIGRYKCIKSVLHSPTFW